MWRSSDNSGAVALAAFGTGLVIGLFAALAWVEYERGGSRHRYRHGRWTGRGVVDGVDPASVETYGPDIAHDAPDDAYVGDCVALRVSAIEAEIREGDPERLKALFEQLDLNPDELWIARRPHYLEMANARIRDRRRETGEDCDGGLLE